MALTKLSTDLNNISALVPEPNDVGGLSATTLQSRFDKAGNDIKTYINDTLTVETDAAIADVEGVGRTTETIKGAYDNLATHKLPTTGDHDGRYYTETEIDGKIVTLNGVDATNASNLTTHKTSGDHDSRYYTESEIDTKVVTLNGVDATNSTNLTTHKTSSDHIAAKIPYDSTGNTKITGTTVQAALTNAENELKAIIGVNANVEVASAHVSTVKSKTFVDLDGRLEESEQDLVTYKADNAKVYYYFNRQDESADTSNTMHGECCIIKAYGKVIMIDTGGSNRQTSIKKYLADIGVTHIDYLIVTHYHEDHIGLFSDGNLSNINWAGCKAYLPLMKVITGDDVTSFYNNTLAKCAEYGITTVYPNEGDELVLNDYFKIKLLNCGSTAFADLDSMGSTWYNSYSMVCIAYHNSAKVIHGGDATKNTEARLFTNGLIEHADLYKHHHHGLNADSISVEYGYNLGYYRTISPDMVISMNSDENTYNSIISDLTVYPSSTKLYKALYSNALFVSQNGIVSYVYGTKYDSGARGFTGQDLRIYVNPSSINSLEDGSSTYPFKSLLDAIAFAKGFPNYFGFTIYLTAGTYPDYIPLQEIKGRLTIQGDNSNPGNYVFPNGIKIVRCNDVIINGIKLSGNIKGNYCAYSQNSNVSFNNVLFDGYNFPTTLVTDSDVPIMGAFKVGFYIDRESRGLIYKPTFQNLDVGMVVNANSSCKLSQTVTGTSLMQLIAAYTSTVYLEGFPSAVTLITDETKSGYTTELFNVSNSQIILSTERILPNTANLNTLTTPGVYWASSTKTISNMPVADTCKVITEFITPDGANLLQTAKDINGNIYVRSYTASAWGAWKQVQKV